MCYQQNVHLLPQISEQIMRTSFSVDCDNNYDTTTTKSTTTTTTTDLMSY